MAIIIGCHFLCPHLVQEFLLTQGEIRYNIMHVNISGYTLDDIHLACMYVFNNFCTPCTRCMSTDIHLSLANEEPGIRGQQVQRGINFAIPAL